MINPKHLFPALITISGFMMDTIILIDYPSKGNPERFILLQRQWFV
jgi:hypothetical protein